MEDILEQLGFNKTEALVYLKLLEVGKATPARIAKLTGINRTTVYSTSETLQEMGVITEDLGGKSMYLLAVPDGLENMIKKEERRLKQRKQLTNKAVEQLSQISARPDYSVPKIRFIEDREFEDYLYSQTPVWNKSLVKCDKTWWGFQDHSFPENYSEWIDWYWKNSPDTILLKTVSNESKVEFDIRELGYERRMVNFWKEDTDFTGTIWVVGEYVMLIQTRQRPHYMVEIHDAVMAHNLGEYFKNTWKLVS